MQSWLGYVAVFLLAYAVTNFVLPKIIPRLLQRGLSGRDMNKLARPEVAEMGGIAVFFGFVSAIMLALFFHSYFGLFQGLNLTALLAASSTIVIIGFIGLVDDLLGWKSGIKQWQKTVLPIVAALPLMVLPESIGFTDMVVPFVGGVQFGILYSLIIVPIAVTGASNAVNMLAGFNGLEAGVGAIVSGTLALAILLIGMPPGSPEALFLVVAMGGACLGFLLYNWYPARIFPGNITTYAIGATVAAAVIIGNMERVGAILLAPQIGEFFLKARSRFQAENFGKVGKDGRLSYDGPIHSLTHLTMKLFRPTEQQLVLYLLALQALAGIAAIASIYV